MSQKKAKKDRYNKKIEADIKMANKAIAKKQFVELIRNLPLNKALIIECDAVDERHIRLPAELGNEEFHLDFTYTKPECGKVAFVIKKDFNGEVSYGIKSIDVFERKTTLTYNNNLKEFVN